MKPGASVTLRQVNSAALNTQKELFRAGFWNEGSRLQKTEVYWCRLPQITVPDALGFFVAADHIIHSLVGYQVGHIYIPKWVLLHGTRQRRGSLRDILRHEYGHSLAYHYPALINGKRFQEIFGRKYNDEDFSEDYEGDFVSDYASTRPMEDFAETFMVYLRCRGTLPIRFATPSIKKKFAFIRDLGRVVASGGSKW